MTEEVACMDALDYMASFEDEAFDLIILDPDYQDWERLVADGILDEAMRILKKTGNIICFTKQPFDYKLRIAVEPWFRREIVWTFENGGAWCSPKMPLVSAQKIYWLIKSKDFYFNPRTGLAYSEKTKDFKRKSKVFGDYESAGKLFNKSTDGIWLRDHLHYNKPNTGKIPSKPQTLLDVLVRCFAPKGGSILDPFAGTGTGVIAADKNDCSVWACDIDRDRVNNILDKCFASVVGEEGELNDD